ncbi:S-adenosylmethionine decarboxylase [Protomyces lactucae-debilis]|uniref:S-adenosylmethionine decarboxylase proenzyme n=1 Tax=Protomyces lactucae-debilis TaxID=2754530 RepID=A0A1Y2F5D0_PROLT|nr:S-adenosylmethionine decarboxylase [Protomyces lactucae-debilis]ORY79069.1 S-adenosylmethionine decarboxylase [Protomyces lactucae-debilis]
MTQTEPTKTIVQDWSETGFEGPEKLLEVWFCASPDDLPSACKPQGLKVVPRDVWETMLDQVQCKVLSVINAIDIDAYLLSESSMFVFPHKLILKTCGTTTLLAGLQALLDIARDHAAFPQDTQPWRVFYSRKNYMFPDAQKAPHKTWQDEMNYLDRFFDGGSAYQIGPMNGDHWFLYMFSQAQQQVLESGAANEDDFEDETLEVLMTELDVNKAQQFYKSTIAATEEDMMADMMQSTTLTKHEEQHNGANGAHDDSSVGHVYGTICSKQSGLQKICCRRPSSVMDSFVFDPLGYSANMVDGTSYATIHITPEQECSYASFETNMTGAVKDLSRVLDVFLPGKFTMTRFATQRDDAKTTKLKIEGYRRCDLIHYELDGYFLEFQNWKKL